MQPLARSCPITLVMLEALAFTITVAVVEWIKGPEVPVTVRVKIEGVTRGERLKFKIEVVEPPPTGVMGSGVNDADTPTGEPVAVRVTDELNPFRELTFTTEVADPPVLTATGEIEPMEKSRGVLAGVAGRLGWGFVADRVAAPRLLLLGIALLMAVAAGLMSLFTAAWPVGAIAAVVILLGATASGWNGVFLAEIIHDVRPAEVGLATSGSMMFAYMGTVLGPSLFGRLASAVGFPKAYLVIGAAVLLGGIFGAFGRAGRSDSARA